MNKIVIGITGGFGVGKSTVGRIFEKLGGYFLDADAITHALYHSGSVGYRKIEGYFGQEFVDSKKGVKRGKLRREVLKNPQKLWILNKLMHPLITHEMSKKIVQSKRQFIFLESVYFEKADLGKLIDRLIEVRREADLVRKTRKREGKWNLEDIDRFMKLSQISPKPDIVLENNGTLDELEGKAEIAWRARVFLDKIEA